MTVPAVSESEDLRGGTWLTALAVGAWAVVIAAAWKAGEPNRILWKLRAAPIAGFFDRHVTPATFVVLALGLVLARVLPGWCARAGWRRLLLVALIVPTVWGSALALTRGIDGLDRGLGAIHEYPAVVVQVDEVGVREFVRTFSTEPVLRNYPIHVQGHPVGSPLLFVALDRVGFGGSGGGALFVLLVSATAVPAVLLTVRELAGDDRARRAAPFLLLAPSLVWWVTSADALFATVASWGVCFLVLATRGEISGRRRAMLSLAGGLAWGVGLHLSYGLVPVGLIAFVAVASRRRWDVMGWAVIGGAIVFGVSAAAGFWWLDGLAATKIRYLQGISEFRPGSYFGRYGNAAALGLAIGPAAWVAAFRVKDPRLVLLGGTALFAATVANLSGLSKGEVERIWLPFVPWILVLTAGLAAPQSRSAPAPRRSFPSFAPAWPALAANLLVAQVLVAVAVETFVKTPW